MPEPDRPATPAVRELSSIDLVLVRHAQARNLPGTEYDADFASMGSVLHLRHDLRSEY